MSMAMARASSGLQYPERFYAAASYVGFDGSNSPTKSLTSKFPKSTALLLYSLYQQVLFFVLPALHCIFFFQFCRWCFYHQFCVIFMDLFLFDWLKLKIRWFIVVDFVIYLLSSLWCVKQPILWFWIVIYDYEWGIRLMLVELVHVIWWSVLKD
jgi:hypothetical protein